MSQDQRRRRQTARRRRGLLLTAGFSVAALAAILVLPTSEDRPAAVVVIMNEFDFVPGEVHANPGQEVRVTNEGGGVPPGSVGSDMRLRLSRPGLSGLAGMGRT